MSVFHVMKVRDRSSGPQWNVASDITSCSSATSLRMTNRSSSSSSCMSKWKGEGGALDITSKAMLTTL